MVPRTGHHRSETLEPDALASQRLCLEAALESRANTSRPVGSRVFRLVLNPQAQSCWHASIPLLEGQTERPAVPWGTAQLGRTEPQSSKPAATSTHLCHGSLPSQ